MVDWRLGEESYALRWPSGCDAGIAPVALYLWARQRRIAPEASEPADPGLNSLRLLSLVFGVALAIVGAALFLAPDWLLEDWPWPITPLIARVFAGWYLLTAVALLYSAWSLRWAHEIPIPYTTVAAWGLLTLLVVPLYNASVNSDAAGYWPFIVLHGWVLAFCVAAVARSLALMRVSGRRL